MPSNDFFMDLKILHKSGAVVYPVLKHEGDQSGVTVGGELVVDPQDIVRRIIAGDVSVRCSNPEGTVSANLTIGKPAAPRYELAPQYHAWWARMMFSLRRSRSHPIQLWTSPCRISTAMNWIPT